MDTTELQRCEGRELSLSSTERCAL